MKIGKLVFAPMFAIGLGSSCAYAQTATFTAVVAQVDRAAGIISLAQALPTKPTNHDSPTMTADYRASTLLLNTATVGATVQATVQRIYGKPTITALTPNGVSTSSSTPALTSSPTSATSNPVVLTPSGIK